jgi:hypothetical protein
MRRSVLYSLIATRCSSPCARRFRSEDTRKRWNRAISCDRPTPRRMAGFLLATFYLTMVAAGLIVEFVFQASAWFPKSAMPRSFRRP